MVTWQIEMPPFDRTGVKGLFRGEPFVSGQLEGYRVLQTMPGNKQVPWYTNWDQYVGIDSTQIYTGKRFPSY